MTTKLEKIHGHATVIDGRIRVAEGDIAQWVPSNSPPAVIGAAHNALQLVNAVQNECRQIAVLAAQRLQRRYPFYGHPDGVTRPWGYIDRGDREEIARLAHYATQLLQPCEDFIRLLGQLSREAPARNLSEKARRGLDVRKHRHQIVWKAHRIYNLASMMLRDANRMRDTNPNWVQNQVDFNDPVDSDPEGRTAYDSGDDDELH